MLIRSYLRQSLILIVKIRSISDPKLTLLTNAVSRDKVGRFKNKAQNVVDQSYSWRQRLWLRHALALVQLVGWLFIEPARCVNLWLLLCSKLLFTSAQHPTKLVSIWIGTTPTLHPSIWAGSLLVLFSLQLDFTTILCCKQLSQCCLYRSQWQQQPRV